MGIVLSLINIAENVTFKNIMSSDVSRTDVTLSGRPRLEYIDTLQLKNII